MTSRPHSAVIKRSIVINGHKTSVSLEDAFWDGLKSCAAAADKTLSSYIGAIDIDRTASNLSSTLRLHVLAQAIAERDALREMQVVGLPTARDDSTTRTGNGFRAA